MLLVVSCVQSNVSTQSSGVGQISPVNLRCEYLVDPLGVGVVKPRLSWKLESSQRVQKQSGYRLLVAISFEKLDSNVGDLWGSGKVQSDQSIHLVYNGRELSAIEMEISEDWLAGKRYLNMKTEIESESDSVSSDKKRIYRKNVA